MHLIVYPDLNILRKVYSYYINTALNDKNETVIVLPFFETTDTVRRALRESEFDIDVTKHEKQRSLLVMDSLKGYLGSAEGVWPTYKASNRACQYIRKKWCIGLWSLGIVFLSP